MVKRAAEASGRALFIAGPGGFENHPCGSQEEASARAAFITEALSWIGTPFRDCADVKGRNGGVDCAMMLTRSAVDTGLIEPFDPRPYEPRWHLHRSEEKFLAWVDRLGGKPVEEPRPGDVILWRFGRCFSHCAVLINSREVAHAYCSYRQATVTPLDEPMLSFVGLSQHKVPRPVLYFDVWSGR
jgi:cell wall-associated NlpC family hydrolase